MSRITSNMGGVVEKAWGKAMLSGDGDALRISGLTATHLQPLFKDLPLVTPIIATQFYVARALENAVWQIRSVEKTGGATREMAAECVESCRQVAIEARLAIGEGYRTSSEELKEFEMGLQPVFRPDSAESEFIKGV